MSESASDTSNSTSNSPGDDGTPTGAGRPVAGTGDIDIALVTLSFAAADPDQLLAALSKYVVLARGEIGCRNIDLCSPIASPSRFVIIEKWESADSARTHFDSEVMIEMAQACTGILTEPPVIDLLEGLSAHDLA